MYVAQEILLTPPCLKLRCICYDKTTATTKLSRPMCLDIILIHSSNHQPSTGALNSVYSWLYCIMLWRISFYAADSINMIYLIHIKNFACSIQSLNKAGRSTSWHLFWLLVIVWDNSYSMFAIAWIGPPVTRNPKAERIVNLWFEWWFVLIQQQGVA